MPTYTVYQPPLREGCAVSDPERFAFVRDGFAFWAFVVPPLWMMLNRLWLALVIYLVAGAAISGGFYFARFPETAQFLVGALLALLIGLEAATLRRWTLLHRGWTQAGFVVAEDDEEAERRFFMEWIARAPTPIPPSPPSSVTPVPPRKLPDVIGLFPQPGAAR